MDADLRDAVNRSPLSNVSVTEVLDWQEVWCFRCAHDHEVTHVYGGTGESCNIYLRAIVGADCPEHIETAYDIAGVDVRTGETDSLHVEGSMIPAAVWCTAFERCAARDCDLHPNGLRITARRLS